MIINQFINQLSSKDPDERKEALRAVLKQEKLSFYLQEEEPSHKAPRGIENCLLTPWSSDPGLLFCAHYDAVPGSFGANDNAASLCILIELAKALREKEIPARFAFFDGEESGNTGSRLFASSHEMDTVTGVINLDVCGYGDTIAVYDRGHAKKEPIRSFCSKKILDSHNGLLVKYLPPSDEASFTGKRIPAISIAIIPHWDIQYLNALSRMGVSNLFRTPEFDLILSQMEVTTTMHGGYRDSPEWVEKEAMTRVYHYLLESVLTLPEKKKKFLLF
jgi:hypothetical protein